MEARKVLELLNGPTGFATGIELTTVEEMLRRGHVSHYEKGQFVTRRGQGDVRLCIVLSGMVRLTAYTEDGREMLTHIIMPGDCWGVHPCLGGYSETNDAIVEQGGLILIVRPDIVSDLMWTRQDFQKAMVGLLCQRLNLTVSLAEQLGFWSARERIAWRLLLLANAINPKHDSHIKTEIRLSQETLASMVHLSRQRTNIVLKAMEKDGRLALKYGTIRILDLNALRAETRRTS